MTGSEPTSGATPTPMDAHASAPRGAAIPRLLGRVVAPVHGFAREVLDSPLVELDLRELFASWRVGAILGFLTLVVGLASGLGAAASGEAATRAVILRSGMGHFLVLVAQLATLATLTILVPVRATGLIEGARWRGYFDQLVTSGLTPSAYFLGRALSAQGMIALVFFGTAPLILALGLTDPPVWRTVLVNEALLLIYAELLLAVTLGFGALIHESLATLTTILLAASLALLGALPVPSALVALSPARAIGDDLWTAMATQLTPAEREVLFGAPRVMGAALPELPYAFALSVLVGTLAASACFLGRPHAFAPGHDSFGAVVLKGDRRRASILRFRPTLVRRGELAFFFENQGPRHARLAPWARLGRAVGLLLLTTYLPLLVLWDDAIFSLVTAADRSELGFMITAGVFLALALQAPLVFATSKNDAPIDLALGRFRIPMVLADVVVYAALAVGLLIVFEQRVDALLATGATFTLRSKQNLEIVQGLFEWARVLSVFGGALLLVQKIFGLRLNDAILGAVIAWLIGAATALPLAAVNPQDLQPNSPHVHRRGHPRADEDETAEHTPEGNALTLAALQICPALRLRLEVDPSLLDGVPLPPGTAYVWMAHEGFWVIYPVLELFLLLATGELVRLRRREAKAALELELAAPGPAKPGVPA